MKGLPRSRARGRGADVPIKRDIIKLRNFAITTTGLTGVGYGTAVIGDFPEGNIRFLGAVANLAFSSASANVTATYEGDYAIGTTPTADATVTGTDANIVDLTAIGPAVAKVTPVARGTGATAAIFDNTDGSLELNLNLIIDDASISADATAFTVTGEIYVSYVILGDD